MASHALATALAVHLALPAGGCVCFERVEYNRCGNVLLCICSDGRGKMLWRNPDATCSPAGGMFRTDREHASVLRQFRRAMRTGLLMRAAR